MTTEIPTPLACPCCGNKNLQIGGQGVCLYGVKCLDLDKFYDCDEFQAGCGLSLTRYLGDVEDDVEYKEKVQLTLRQAVLDWNQRVGAKNESSQVNRWSWSALVKLGQRWYRRTL